MYNSIYVQQIIDTMLDSTYVRIYVIGANEVYKFPMSNVPDEVCEMEIQSIDNPESYEVPLPITLNVDEEDFNNYSVFAEKYKDYLD